LINIIQIEKTNAKNIMIADDLIALADVMAHVDGAKILEHTLIEKEELTH
jgi:hypothetical protein